MFLFSDRATSSRLAQYRRETLQKALRLPAEAAFAPADGAALGVPLPHAASSSDIAAASAAAQPAGRFWIRSGIDTRLVIACHSGPPSRSAQIRSQG
jgi:hypothetical protein